MSKLAVVWASVGNPTADDCIDSWLARSSDFYDYMKIDGLEIMQAYQQGFENSSARIIAYLHDDLECEEANWDERLLREFDDPKVGLVGFAGALGHGDPQMYRKPYELGQLGRSGFRSNLREAEIHGTRFTGSCDVAVLDGLALVVRREVLEKAGGWPQRTPVGYISYDYWLCCETRRQGYRIRMVGIQCHHLGGKSTGLGPQKIGREDFEAAHKYIYDSYRDVLPYRVSQ